MRVVPREIANALRFYEIHLGPWSDRLADVGLSDADLANLRAKTEAARAACMAQQSAQDAARAATLNCQLALGAMSQAGSSCIKKIRAAAGSGGDGVYVLAEISPPAAGGPLPEPGKPTQLAVALLAGGALTLSWKCPNPAGARGTMYHLWRRIEPAGAFEFIGATGKKSFTDDTLPAGSAAVMYRIQAVRSTATGPAELFNVNFGATRATTAMVHQTGPTKIAA